MELDGPLFDYTLKAPFCMTIAGQTQSGKSTLTEQILKRRHEIIEPHIDHVMYHYTQHQPKLFQRLQNHVPDIQFQLGLPTDYGSYLPGNKLMVLDDLMVEAAKSKDAVNAFTRTSHHQNVSIIFLTQNLFFKNTKDMVGQCKYIVAMKNPRDSAFINYLGMQMNSNKKNDLVEAAYKDVMNKPYGYLVLDYGQMQNNEYRVRTGLFPEDMVIYSK